MKNVAIIFTIALMVFCFCSCKNIDKNFCGKYYFTVKTEHSYGTKYETTTYNLKEDGFYEKRVRVVDCGYETSNDSFTGEWYKEGEYIYINSYKVFKIVDRNSLVLISNTSLEVKKIESEE